MVDMRHAAAGNVLMLKMATSASQLLHSHTFAAQPAAVGMSPKRSPRVAAMGSPLLTVLDARECHSVIGGQHRADIQIQHATPLT